MQIAVPVVFGLFSTVLVRMICFFHWASSEWMRQPQLRFSPEYIESSLEWSCTAANECQVFLAFAMSAVYLSNISSHDS